MKNKSKIDKALTIVLIICSIIVISSFIFVIKSLYIDTYTKSTMKAVILKVDDVLKVAEIESGSYKVFNVEYKTTANDEYKQGQEILIDYSGMVIDMPYPSYITPYKIKVLKDESEIIIPENVLIFKHTL